MNAESIDAGLNLAAAQAAQKELQRSQNERLQLLSESDQPHHLEPGASRTVARDLSQHPCESCTVKRVGVYLADSASESFTLLAFDFPVWQSLLRRPKTLSARKRPPKTSFDTLKPVIVKHGRSDIDVHPAGYELTSRFRHQKSLFVPLSTHDRALGVRCASRIRRRLSSRRKISSSSAGRRAR